MKLLVLSDKLITEFTIIIYFLAFEGKTFLVNEFGSLSCNTWGYNGWVEIKAEVSPNSLKKFEI